jgi:tetratricopeptide (TPR) repeat protein
MFCSIVFSKTDILWDFGVVIKTTDHHDISSDNFLQTSSELNKIKTKKNAVIFDPFVPPIKSNFLLQKSNRLNSAVNDWSASELEKNIFPICNEAKRFYFMKNYIRVIELIQYSNLSSLKLHNRQDLEYLLANSLYHTGKYQKAKQQVLNSLKDNETDRLYLLLAMIYESLEQNNTAREYYQTLITQYPASDYATSAYIKLNMLNRY